MKRESDIRRPLAQPVSRIVCGLLAGTAVTALSLSATMQVAQAAGAGAQGAAVEQLADADTVLDFAIAPQALPAALDRFAERAGLSLAYKTGDLSDLTSPGVSGRMSTAVALQQLLTGTGIVFEFTDADTVLLIQTGGGASDGAPVDRIVVVGSYGVGDHLGAADQAGSLSVTREDLERRNPQTAKDVFAGESEVSVGGAIRSSQKIYVNGIEETNLAVTIDGARQNNKVFHHNGTNLIDPSLLKGVRVDPGVAPADAGPGALGGAIVFETVDVDDVLAPDRSFGGFATGSFDTNSGTFTNGTSGYGRAGGFEVLGYFNWGLGGEYSNGKGDVVPGTETDFRSVLAKGAYETEDGEHRFELSVENLHDQAARPFRANIGSIDGVGNPLTRTYEMERRNIVFNYNSPQAEGLWDPKVVIGYGQTDVNVPEPYGSEGRSSSFSGKIENDFNFEGFGFGDTITVGVDYYDDRAIYDDPSGDDMRETARNLGGYAQARLQPLEPLRLSFGLRADQQWFEGIDGTEIDHAGLSGNVSAAFDVTSFLTLHAGYSNVFGGIALAENYIMNPGWDYSDGIDPVRSQNYTAGFDVYYEGFTLDGGVFLSDFKDARDPTYGGGPGLTVDFETKGFNIGAGYNWGPGFVRVSYTDSQIELDGDPADSDTSQYLGAPLGRIIAVEAVHSFTDIGVTVGGSVDAALDNDDTEDAGYEPLDGYEVLNLFAEYRPDFAEFLTLRVEANNIFDANYADRATYGQEFATVEPLREAGRSFLFVVRAKF